MDFAPNIFMLPLQLNIAYTQILSNLYHTNTKRFTCYGYYKKSQFLILFHEESHERVKSTSNLFSNGSLEHIHMYM